MDNYFGSSSGTPSSPFGGTSLGGGSAFGHNTSSNPPFGMLAGPTPPRFQPTAEIDDCVFTTFPKLYQHISCMPAYRHLSAEELRLEDYTKNRTILGRGSPNSVLNVSSTSTINVNSPSPAGQSSGGVSRSDELRRTSGTTAQQTKSLRSVNLDFAWLALDNKNFEEREKLMKAALEDILDQCLKIAREHGSNGVGSFIETALKALSQVDERRNDAKEDRVQAMSLALYQIVADATRLGNPGTDSVADSPSRTSNNNPISTTGEEQPPFSEASRDDSCVICQERPRESAFIPCGHLVCCVPCAKELEDRSRSGSGSSLIPGASSNAAFGSSISTPAFGGPLFGTSFSAFGSGSSISTPASGRPVFGIPSPASGSAPSTSPPAFGGPVFGTSSPASGSGPSSSTSGVGQTISGSSAFYAALSTSRERPPFGVSAVATAPLSSPFSPAGTTHGWPVFTTHPVRSLSSGTGPRTPGEGQFKCPVCRVWCKGSLRIWK